jgi:uncharacterized protein (TIGR02611 family)
MIRKASEIVCGFGLLAVGLILSIPGVPGPGFVVILAGLVILARHFHWAKRALAWTKEKWEKAKSRLKRTKDK